MSKEDNASDESGRGRLSLGEGAGDSGHLNTRLDPLAEVVSKRRARSVSAMKGDGLAAASPRKIDYYRSPRLTMNRRLIVVDVKV